MGTLNSIDVKVALFLRKCFNYYINKRTYSTPPPTQEQIWDSLFVNTNAISYTLDNDLKIMLYKDSILSKLIYFGFEKTELSFIGHYLRTGDIFIDVGSNIGLYSIYASKLVGEIGKVYSFEPTPETYRRLCENIILNNLKNVKAINIGLSNNKGITDFNISYDGHDAWNSFAKLEQLELSNSIQVNIETLDSIVEENQLDNISLVKIDVEGWEKFVFEGSNKLLNREKPPVFLVEFTETNAFAAGYYCGELFDYVKSFGFEWYSYDENSNSLVSVIKKLHYPYENLIAVKDYNTCHSRIIKEI